MLSTKHCMDQFGRPLDPERWGQVRSPAGGLLLRILLCRWDELVDVFLLEPWEKKRQAALTKMKMKNGKWPTCANVCLRYFKFQLIHQLCTSPKGLIFSTLSGTQFGG